MIFSYFLFIGVVLGVGFWHIGRKLDQALQSLLPIAERMAQERPMLEVDMMCRVGFRFVSDWSAGFAEARFISTFVDLSEAEFITSCELILNIYESAKDDIVQIDTVRFIHFDNEPPCEFQPE